MFLFRSDMHTKQYERGKITIINNNLSYFENNLSANYISFFSQRLSHLSTIRTQAQKLFLS